MKEPKCKTATKYLVPRKSLSTCHLKGIGYQQLRLDIDCSSTKKSKIRGNSLMLILKH